MREKSVLLIGGYGATGGQVARLMRRVHPACPITIGGRNLEKAQALADQLGSADVAEVDLNRSDLGLSGGGYSAISIYLKDDTLNTMRFAAVRGIGYLSLSSGAFESGIEFTHGLAAARAAPIVLASHWFSGALTLAVLEMATGLASIDRVEAGVLVDPGDVSAPSASAADFDRIDQLGASLLLQDGRYAWVRGVDAAVRSKAVDDVALPGTVAVSTDCAAIGAATGAQTVLLRQAFGMSASRRSGGDPTDELLIDVEGIGMDGRPCRLRREIVASRRSASLTAISNLVLLERLLGLDGRAPLVPGLYLPEHLIDPASYMLRLRSLGAAISDQEIPQPA